MTAPTNTYNSTIDLNLGHIPQIDDPAVYQALLDIHNALESLVTGVVEEGLTKNRNVTVTTGPSYKVLVTDGLILTDTTVADVTVTLPGMTTATTGYKYEIKQIAGTNETLIVGDGTDPVDDDITGITIDLLEAISVKNDGVKWWLNN